MLHILLVALVIGIPAAIVAGIAQSHEQKKRLDEEAKALKLDQAHTSTTRHISRPINCEFRSLGLRFAISADRKTAYLLYSSKQPTLTVPTSYITGCQIIKDGIAPHVGRGAIGGGIAGDAGAVIGAFSGPQIPYNMRLVVFLKNGRAEYSLLDNSTLHTTLYYNLALKFAEDVSDIIRGLR